LLGSARSQLQLCGSGAPVSVLPARPGATRHRRDGLARTAARAGALECAVCLPRRSASARRAHCAEHQHHQQNSGRASSADSRHSERHQREVRLPDTDSDGTQWCCGPCLWGAVNSAHPRRARCSDSHALPASTLPAGRGSRGLTRSVCWPATSGLDLGQSTHTRRSSTQR
jgi:hypothetical protein